MLPLFGKFRYLFLWIIEMKCSSGFLKGIKNGIPEVKLIALKLQPPFLVTSARWVCCVRLMILMAGTWMFQPHRPRRRVKFRAEGEKIEPCSLPKGSREEGRMQKWCFCQHRRWTIRLTLLSLVLLLFFLPFFPASFFFLHLLFFFFPSFHQSKLCCQEHRGKAFSGVR